MQFRLGVLTLILITALSSSSISALGAPAPAASDTDWNKTVAAAKKEGKLVIIGTVGADVKDSHTIGFQKKYPEIKVDFIGMSGSTVAPKLLAALKANQYLTDIVVAGTTTVLMSLLPSNALVPLQPYLATLETWWSYPI